MSRRPLRSFSCTNSQWNIAEYSIALLFAAVLEETLLDMCNLRVLQFISSIYVSNTFFFLNDE